MKLIQQEGLLRDRSTIKKLVSAVSKLGIEAVVKKGDTLDSLEIWPINWDKHNNLSTVKIKKLILNEYADVIEYIGNKRCTYLQINTINIAII